MQRLFQGDGRVFLALDGGSALGPGSFKFLAQLANGGVAVLLRGHGNSRKVSARTTPERANHGIGAS